MTLLFIELVSLQAQLASWRTAGDRIALVPTMGALHAGHLQLIEVASTYADRVVATIFVNPKQFAPHEDFAKYPRRLDEDRALLASEGCDLVWAPKVETIYPQNFATSVDVGALGTLLEGAIRPHHFVGVATVVTRLLMLVRPDIACFGEKDFQQLQIIRQVVRDLALPVTILGVPTVRADDGLALSSRNAYLSADARQKAAALPRILQETMIKLQSNMTAAEPVLEDARQALQAAGFVLDYLELVDAETLKPSTDPSRPQRLMAAVRLGTTRLIDNMAL
jgi:pantoate--beta-alanine ligase